MSCSKGEEPVASFYLTFNLFQAYGPQHGKRDTSIGNFPVYIHPCTYLYNLIREMWCKKVA